MKKMIVVAGSGMVADKALFYFKNEGFIFHLGRSGVDDLEGNELAVDFADAKSFKKAVDILSKRAGKIDVLINLLGLLEADKHDAARFLTENILRGTRNCITAFQKLVKRSDNGRIINIAPPNIQEPIGLTVSESIRTGMKGIGSLWARELGSHGATVNTIIPGYIEELAGASNMVEPIPMKRSGKLEDIFKVITFLASSDADYISGACINVDGGLNA